MPQWNVAVTQALDKEIGSRALDELFSLTSQYHASEAYGDLLKFIARFRHYSPFNAMLVHIQMPGAVYVAPPHRWLRDWQRRIRPGARPLVILQPKGPVMFVFDVSDVEGGPNAPSLPLEVVCPFAVRGGKIRGELDRTIENAKRDGVRISFQDAGSQSAGQIGIAKAGGFLDVVDDGSWPRVKVPIRYELILNSKHTAEERFATTAHELGHLYCGHLGTINPNWWPARTGLEYDVREFEAESVSFIVCQRLGIDTPSEKYLAGFLRNNAEVPPISLNAVLSAASLIERMGHERLKTRKIEVAKPASSN